MKNLIHMLAGVFLILGSLQAEEKINFPLSTATARKMNANPRETFVAEFGDANGPFMQIGAVLLNASGSDHFSVSVGNKTTGLSLGITDPKINLHVEYFVNEKGNGFGVVHKSAVVTDTPAVEEEPEDDRPSDHVALCESARWAIARCNTKLLEALLQAALSINVPLDWDTQWTALHYAAVHNEPRAAKMLVENGADLDARCKYGKRPIDYAFEDGQMELCDALRKPDKNERNVGDYPEALLDELFLRSKDKEDEVRFLSLNGNDPNNEQLTYFRRFWPNVRARSQAQEIDRNAEPKGKAKTSYRDLKTKDYGIVVEIILKRTSDDTFDWSHREATGPSLAGGGNSGKISKKYGYWLKHSTSSWDE